ncbi:hypothetical protein [Actinoplanes sp. NPDC023714]|uniref:hypothetical protein n=1 Tax=Actinoplanes sp. NPDC023714 TaxID=3154322 RepID=UPI0033F44448
MFTLHSRVLAALVPLVVLLAPAPAAAHPFGDPQTVAISRDPGRPDVVDVRWRVGGPDDLTVLGIALGLLPEGSAARYTDAGVVGGSARFSSYLLERITVSGSSTPCAGAVKPVAALALKGATVSFTCPGPITTATVSVRMLTDLNPAYRTLATGPGGQRNVYDEEHVAHSWTLDGDPPGRGGTVALLALLLAAVGAGFLVVRRVRA